MLVNVYVAKDNKFFLYVVYNQQLKRDLAAYEDVPEAIRNKFYDGRYIITLDITKKKLIQIKDYDSFIKQLNDNKYFLIQIEDNFVEKQIEESSK